MVDLVKWFEWITYEKHSIFLKPKSVQSTSSYLFPNYFQNKSGLWIHYRCWNNIKSNTPIKGVIIISHGYGQHINQYSHIGKLFNDNNYIVYGIDHQGHGLSDGDRGYFKDLNDLIYDLIYFSEKIKLKHNNIPLFLFGHSMGGLIGMYCGLLKQNNKLYNGIILSSPMLLPGKDEQIKLTPFLNKIAIFINKNFPKLPFIKCYGNGLTNNKIINYRLKNDYLKLYGMMPLRSGYQMKDKGEQMLYNLSNNIIYPFYIFAGSNDKIIDPNAIKLFYNNAKTIKNNKKINIYNGLLHETLNENELYCKIIFNSILDWINKINI